MKLALAIAELEQKDWSFSLHQGGTLSLRAKEVGNGKFLM